MTHRYHVPDLPPSGGSVPLPTTEAHHARTVMRVRSGDAVELFDGRGRVAAAWIDVVDKRQILCQVQPPREESRLPARTVILGVGLPKGDRAKFLIEKLTELGVARCVPLLCQRSQWSPSPAALEKLRRAMLEACKQCGRNQLLQLDDPVAAIDWFDGTSDQDAASEDAAREPSVEPQAVRVLAHPPEAAGGAAWSPQSSAWPELAAAASRPIKIAVGPEGGFTVEEVAAAEAAGWQTVGLGKLVYRIETAAIALATLAIHR